MAIQSSAQAEYPKELAEVDPALFKSKPTRIEIIRTVDALKWVDEDWRDLESRSTDGLAYFQSYDWCLRWSENFLNSANEEKTKLAVALVYKGSTLACVWPLIITRPAPFITVARFLGEPLSQYCNVIIDRNLLSIHEARECWKQIRKDLKCDTLAFNQIIKDSPLSQVLEQDLLHPCPADHSLMMDVRQLGDWESFEAGLKKPQRKRRRKRRRVLEELGEVKFEAQFGGSDEYSKLVRQAIDYKMVWLKENGRRMTSFADQRTTEFLAELSGDASQNAGAIAFGLYLDGRPIAIELGFNLHGHYYCYLGAFDWNLRDNSPGKIQMEDTLKWALENDVCNIDFLGSYAAYEGSWSNTQVPMVGYDAANSVMGLVYGKLWNRITVPFIKKTFRALPAAIRKPLVGAT